MSTNSSPASANAIVDPRYNNQNTTFQYIAVDKDGNLLYQNPDNQLINITHSLTNIYNNVLLFNKEDTNTGNLNNLDGYSNQINTSINNLIDEITPCAASTDINKCSMDICKYSIDIQAVIADYYVILMTLTSDGIKENYAFLPFFIIANLSKVITSNPSNTLLGASSLSKVMQF